MSVTNGRDLAPGAPGALGAPKHPPLHRAEPSTEPYRPPLPVIHQIAWVSLLVQMLLIGIMYGIAVYAGIAKPILAATIAYIIFALIIRLFLTSNHRRGMHYAREGRFEMAVSEFERSHDFFSRNAWLDEMRYIFLLSTSKVCYREMALLNLAYCDLWQDRGEDAVRTYLRTIEEFPDSGLAWTGIKLFQQGGHDGERRAAATLAATARFPASTVGASLPVSGAQTEVSFRGARTS